MKENKNKIKDHFKLVPFVFDCLRWFPYMQDEPEITYDFPYIFIFRDINTFNEIKQTDGHLHDEDVKLYNVKIRGKRRPNMIPDSWYDIRLSAIKEAKSWKRNSKRRKQWKPK